MYGIHDTIWQSMTANSDVILSYESLWSSSEESDSDETNSQASYTERLGNTSWYSCVKYLVMPCVFEGPNPSSTPQVKKSSGRKSLEQTEHSYH